jgi:hypothetical protein
VTLPIGSPNNPFEERHLSMTGRTIPLADRLRTADLNVSPDEEPDPEVVLDPVTIMFNALFADFLEKLANGDEEETGNVTLSVDY